MATELEVETYEDLQDLLRAVFEHWALNRRRFLFRGQADASWPLATTLERFCRPNEWHGESTLRQLLEEFNRELSGVASSGTLKQSLSPNDLEHLARHNGLPTSILDWTTSPDVALFFACADPSHRSKQPPDKFALWLFDRNVIDLSSEDPVRKKIDDQLEIFDDTDTIQLHPRAIAQSSVFVRATAGSSTFEAVPDEYLFKFTLPNTEIQRILDRLEAMTITDRTLFADEEGAARTAEWRIRSRKVKYGT